MESLSWTTSVSEVLASKSERLPLITVPVDASLKLAMEVLKDAHFTAVPVVSADGQIRGFVDNLDILRYLQKTLKVSLGSWEAARHIDEILDTPVSKVMDNSEDDTLIFAKPEMTLGSILKFFTGGMAHRCIVDDDGDHAILSQSDVIRFLAKEPTLEGLEDKKLSELLSLSKAVAVSEETILFEMIEFLQLNHLSGVALLDKEGKITGNFSASDLSKIEKIDTDLLMLPASLFLRERSPDSLSPITLRTEATLGEALKTFTEYGIHRLWLVEDSKPAFVVTLTDILKIFVK